MIRCAFCSRPREGVAYMAACEATGAAICDRCVELAHREIERLRGKAQSEAAWKQVQAW